MRARYRASSLKESNRGRSGSQVVRRAQLEPAAHVPLAPRKVPVQQPCDEAGRRVSPSGRFVELQRSQSGLLRPGVCDVERHVSPVTERS